MGNKLIELLTPPPAWRLPVIFFLGIIVGLGIGVFQISNAISYLSDEPVAYKKSIIS